MQKRNYRLKSGFTLVELSIVLVIIGLLVGGILVGRNLIAAAAVRADFGTIESLDAAVNTFKLKYNYLPGDLASPAQFGFDAAAGGDGNGLIQGKGSIGNAWDIAPYSGFKPEWMYAFKHLAQAGLVNLPTDWPINGNWADMAAIVDAGTTFPLMQSPRGNGSDLSAGNKPGIVFGYEQNQFVTGSYFRMNALGKGSLSFNGGYHPTNAKQIDLKFDDGNPLTGRIRAAPPGNSQCDEDIYNVSTPGCIAVISPLAWGNMHCIDSATMDYDQRGTQLSCALRVRASF